MPGLRQDHRLQGSLLPFGLSSDEFGSILQHHGVDVVHHRDVISGLSRGVGGLMESLRGTLPLLVVIR